jgi:hypothetical protein
MNQEYIKNSEYFHDLGIVTLRWVLDWMIGFVDHLHRSLGATSNYSAIADLHTLHFAVTHTIFFSDFTSRILETYFNTGIITVSLNHAFQILLHYSICKVFSSLPDFQLSTKLARLLHHLPAANSGTHNPVLCCNYELFIKLSSTNCSPVTPELD